MTTISYPQTLSQTTGGKYATYNSLANLKNNTTGAHAITKLIKGKSSSPNRPSTISATNFKLNLPTGAKVTSIKVEYRQRLDSYNSKYPSINAPTISLLNVSGYSVKGKAPNKTLTTRSVTFKPKTTTAFSSTLLNSSSFGVKINYPANTNANSGYLRLSYIRITVNYKAPSFSASWSVKGGQVEQNGTAEVSLKISNKNLTDYQPTITITTPAGFTLNGNPSQSGTWTKVNNRTYTWKPKFTSKVGSLSLGLTFDVSVSGSLPVNAVFEAVSAGYLDKSYTVKVVPKTSDTGSEDESGNETPTAEVPVENILKVPRIFVEKGEEFYLTTQFTTEEQENAPKDSVRIQPGVIVSIKYFTLKVYNNPGFLITDFSEETPLSTAKFYIEDYPGGSSQLDSEGNLRFSTYSNQVSQKTLQIYSGNTLLRSFEVDIRPTNLSPPVYTFLKVSPEECNRLGDGHVYTVQSYLQEVTSEIYVRDWNRNFRIGVFNNEITGNINYNNLTNTQIFNNAEYWGNCPTEVNTYENLECEFTYDKDYPLYIIITGDYTEADTMASIKFTEPCIIESDVYNGYEPNGNYPYPILNEINSEGDLSQITLPEYENSTPIIIYNFDLDEDYGTDETIAIRGIGVQLTVDDYSDCVLTAQLKNPAGAPGERSVIIEDEMLDDDNQILIGGLGDLWNFNTLDLVNLKDWEVIITLQNLITQTETTLTQGNTQIIFYVEQVNDQKDWCYINNEDLRYYGAFITDIDIPSGLETSTSYLTVDGTDINDAYRQNIREKTITLELEIGDNCDLTNATDSLRQLTQLILNERDDLNRPIPKQIRFSFMPDVYYEYIVEDAFDNPIDISSYKVKAKLTVPSGTAYKTKPTTTNTTGYVQGLARVPCIISIKPTGDHIEVTENNTGQKWTITYTEDTTDQIILIDTENRKAYLQTDEDSTDNTDITKYVDFNSDWFTLQGAYQFSGTNCHIRAVEYTERW